MRFTPDFLDRIRERLPISQVIGSRVTWDRRKTSVPRGDFWACCPFHGEKSPSFHCEDRKGRYHCFGCGVSGDHFRFLVELDGLSFPEAVERLAAEAGLDMPAPDREAQARADRRRGLHEVMALAQAYFERMLHEPAGAPTRAYLRERGVPPALQKLFGLGYAPDGRSALKQHLAERGVPREDIEACGLVRHGPDIPVSYDWFRDRLTFPILDPRERVIAFGGRAMKADTPAKYMNSPDTDLFHKSDVLYNFARARRAVASAGTMVVAEGYMDVIALHEAGLEHTVAPLGTALTEAQLAMLWRVCDVPILCFDGDEAGRRAAHRAAEMALPELAPGRSLRFALLPEGRDPDDILRQDGAEALRAAVGAAIPLADLLWSRQVASARLDTPEQRASLEANLREMTGRIRDETVRRHYGQAMRDRLGTLFGPAAAGGSARGRGDGFGQKRRGAAPASLGASPALLDTALHRRAGGRTPLREAALVCGIAYHPAMLTRLFDAFAELPFTSTDATRLQGAILDIASDAGVGGEIPDQVGMVSALTAAGLGESFARLTAQVRSAREWWALPDSAFEDAVDGWGQAHSMHLRRHVLEAELRHAQDVFALDETEANFERIAALRGELESLHGAEAMIEGFGVSSGRPLKPM